MTRSAILVLAASLLAAPAWAQTAPAGDAARGEGLYETTGCFQCHGYVGQGGGAGVPLFPLMPFDPFALQLREPRQVMIPYSETVLPAQDVADIYAYLASMPPAPDPSTIPLLREMP